MQLDSLKWRPFPYSLLSVRYARVDGVEIYWTPAEKSYTIRTDASDRVWVDVDALTAQCVLNELLDSKSNSSMITS